MPSLDELLEMSDDATAHLSIHTLKQVLFQNHVNARLVVEKSELVSKVKMLVEEERRERERHAREAEEEAEAEEQMRREIEEAMQRSREEAEERQRRAQESHVSEATTPEEPLEDREAEHMQADEHSVTSHIQEEGRSSEDMSHHSYESQPPPPPPKPAAPSPPPKVLTPNAQAMASRLERTGLCVICQDEEANIAIVDCGHLCLCRACSELIMKGTRECPLCRTRIVTEQRLLRIYRT